MNYMQNVQFMSPESTEQAAIEKRRKLAEALQGQALQNTPTESVGGWAVRQSPLVHLNKLAAAMLGAHGVKKADEEAKTLATEQQNRRSADTALLAQALQGRQGSPGGLQEDVAGNVTQMDPVGAQSPVQAIGQALPMMGGQMQPVALQAMHGAQQRQDQQAFQREQLQSQQAARIQEREMAIQAQNAARQNQQDFQREMVRERAAGDRPFFQFLPSSSGYMAGNARTGTVQPVMHEGAQVVPAAQDPNLQGRIAQNKAGGKELGEAQAQGQIDLPRVKDNAANALQIIDQLVGSEDGKTKPHPGFETYVGATMTPGLRFLEGSDTANFQALLDQSKGGAFLEAFNSLKGGGQITEVEGKKATDAITRMNKAQSEKEFIKAAREYQGIIRKGVERAEGKAKGAYTGPERRVPAGIDPALWSVMTPEEKALWSR